MTTMKELDMDNDSYDYTYTDGNGDTRPAQGLPPQDSDSEPTCPEWCDSERANGIHLADCPVAKSDSERIERFRRESGFGPPLQGSDSSTPAGEINRCPVCACPESKFEEGGPEFDDVGRHMQDVPGVRYFRCGRVHVEHQDGSIDEHESDACGEVAALRERLGAANNLSRCYGERLSGARDEVAALRASLKQARAARDTWHERHNDVVEQRDALRAERDHYIEQARVNWLKVERMRPVVDNLEAALRQYANFQRGAFRDGAPDYVRDALATVDAYRATSEQETTDA